MLGNRVELEIDWSEQLSYFLCELFLTFVAFV